MIKRYMILNILLSPWVIIILILIVALSVIIFLILTEKILKKKVVIKQRREENSPSRRIKLLISTKEEPQNKLRKINAIARELFRNFYRIDTKLSYYELAEKFREEGKTISARFCQDMFTILYSGEELQSSKMTEMAKLLEKIEKEVREDKSFKNLERDMRASIKPQKISIFKKFSKVEDKFIDKFAREKRESQKIQETEQNAIQTQSPKPLPKTTQIPIEYNTKRGRLKNLPLIKLFRFRKEPQTTLTSEKEIKQGKTPIWSKINLNVPILQKKEKEGPVQKEKSSYQKIEDLQKEIIEREQQIEKLRTKQQIKNLERTAVDIEINKDKSWPPVTFTPKHLNEIRKMSPQMEDSFKRTNKEIEILEREIFEKRKTMKKIQSIPVQKIPKQKIEKPSPVIKKFLKKITGETKKIDKEMLIKQKQIKLINLKKEPEYPNYRAPKVVAPKKQKIEASAKKRLLKKEEFIHHVDNMDRIKSRINSRRANLEK